MTTAIQHPTPSLCQCYLHCRCAVPEGSYTHLTHTHSLQQHLTPALTLQVSVILCFSTVKTPISGMFPYCISVLKWNSEVPPHTYTQVCAFSFSFHPPWIFSFYPPSSAKLQLILPPFNTAPANAVTAAGVVADNSQWAAPAPGGQS